MNHSASICFWVAITSLAVARAGRAEEAPVGPPVATSLAAPSVGAGTDAPDVGDDDDAIDAYLGGLKHELESFGPDHRGLPATDERVRTAQARYESERARLWPGTEYYSEGMMIAGAVLTALGGGGAIAGAVSLGALDGASSGYAAMMIFPPSGLLLAIGIPLLAVGAPEVPHEPSERPSHAASVSVVVCPGSVALTGSF